MYQEFFEVKFYIMQTSKAQTKMPRPCTVFYFALIHYAGIYVTNTFLLVSSSVHSKQLLCFVHGQGQKPTTKKFVGFHNHSRELTMRRTIVVQCLLNPIYSPSGEGYVCLTSLTTQDGQTLRLPLPNFPHFQRMYCLYAALR